MDPILGLQEDQVKTLADGLGFGEDLINQASDVFKKLYKGEMNRSQALEYLEKEFSWKDNDITKEIIAFAQSSDRGLA